MKTQMGFFKPNSAVPVDLSYNTQVTSTADLTSYTFNNVNIGTASADRIVVVGITINGSSNGFPCTINSVTIGGNAATQIAQVVGASWATAAIFALAVPSGTTANIVVALNRTAGRCAVASWAMTGASITPADTLTDTNASADPTGTIDIPANGAACAAAISATSTTTTWTGLTEKVDTALEGFSTHTAANDNFASAQTGRTITANFVGAADNAMAVASFGPA